MTVSTERTAPPARVPRRPDIDWLRAAAVLLLVPFHASLIFLAPKAYHITTGERIAWIGYCVGFVGQWHMPLLFVLAGMSTGFAMGFRTPRQYLWERVTRLLIPLAFGMLVVVPPQTYFQRLNEGAFHGSYLDFYPHVFNGAYPKGNLTYNHLWFVAYLFVFSVLALPVFVAIGRDGGRSIVGAIAARCQTTGVIFLLAIPTALTESLFRAKYPGLQTLISDWANFTLYLYLFILGYMICTDERFSAAIGRHAVAALLCGLLTTTIGMSLYVFKVHIVPGASVGWVLLMTLSAFNRWFWLVAILGLGARWLSFENRLLPALREASYPFYILHQTVLITLGFYVMRWNMSAAARFTIIVVATIIATWCLYDLVVRRMNLTRVLFGMKPQTQSNRTRQ